MSEQFDQARSVSPRGRCIEDASALRTESCASTSTDEIVMVTNSIAGRGAHANMAVLLKSGPRRHQRMKRIQVLGESHWRIANSGTRCGWDDAEQSANARERKDDRLTSEIG